jgi:hypothetical protein
MATTNATGPMSQDRIIAFFLSLAFILPSLVFAQKKEEEEKPVFPLDNFYAKRKPNTTRKIHKNFALELSTGYGNTFFSHKLDGFGVVQPANGPPRIFPAGSTIPKYSNWVNNAVGDTLNINPGYFLVSSDTTKLGFKGHGLNIPLKATLHYEYDRYRIGGGYSYEYMLMGPFHSISHKNEIDNFRPSSPGGLMKKYFGMIGVSFFRWNDLLFTADANVGGYKPGKNFNYGLIKKGIYVNAGVTI